MGIRPHKELVFVVIYIGLFTLWSGPAFAISAVTNAAQSDALPPVELPAIMAPDRPEWHATPDLFAVDGRLVDSHGAGIEGATVLAGSSNTTQTGADGFFALPGLVTPDTQIAFSHADYAQRHVPAGSLYSDGLPIEVRTVGYTDFRIEPDGGTYRNGGITVEVPPGAVDTPLDIRVAPLPLDMAYAHDGGLELARVAALDLLPEGTRFRQPVSISVDAVAPADGVETGISQRTRTGSYSPEADASAQVAGGRAVFTLTHFSRHVLHRADEGYTAVRLGTGQDRDGDGRITHADVEFTIALSGGDHTATINQTSTEGTVFFTTTTTSTTSASSSSTTVSAGLGFGPVSVDGSATVGSSQSRTLAEKTGLEVNRETTRRRGVQQRAGEYDDICRYYMRIYEYWRVRTWRLHQPTQRELGAIRRSFDGRSDRSAEWTYMGVPESWHVFHLGHSIRSSRMAVREVDGALEVYVMTGEYVARKPIGMDAVNCGIGDVHGRTEGFVREQQDTIRRGGTNPDSAQGRTELAEGMRDEYGFFGGNRPIASASFEDTGSGLLSKRVAGWGIMPSDELNSQDLRFETNVECVGGRSGSTQISDTVTSVQERSRTQLYGEESGFSASASAEIPLPLSGTLSAGVSGSSSSSTARETARQYGERFFNRHITNVAWSINDPHAPQRVHWSDHMIARLYLVLVTRSWDAVNPDDLPANVRNRPDSQLSFTNGRAFLPADSNRVLMKTADGRWYLSGPPVTQKKPFGLALIRYAERPCPGGPDDSSRTPGPDEDSDDRDETGSGESDEDADTGTQPRRPVITPSPEEYRRQREERERRLREDRGCRDDRPGDRTDNACGPTRQDIRDYWPNTLIAGPGHCSGDRVTCGGSAPPRRSVRASFSRLDGDTQINADYVGTIETVTVVATDGRQRPAETGRNVTADMVAGGIRLAIADDRDIQSVIVTGERGDITVERRQEPAEPAPFLWPLDGAVNLQNGRLRETFSAPAQLCELDAPPSGYRINIPDAETALPEGGTLTPQADVIAVRENEIALHANDVPAGAATDSDIELDITTPSGARAEAEVPAWSYSVSPQPVTQVGVFAPIYFQCTGLPPEEMIELTFVPQPWQTVEPLQLSLPCGEAAQPVPVAQYTTSQVGPQPIQLRVVRQSGD